MIHGSYHKLFQAIRDHVASVRGIAMVGPVDIDEITRVYHRAAQLALLEILLDKHRDENQTPFNDLRGKQALHHLLFTKLKWRLADIRALPLADVLLILHNDLKVENFEPDVAKYINGVLDRYEHLLFTDVIDAEWNPDILEQLPPQNHW
ncbi:TPA: hypothetical protein ACQZHX_002482 [Enterobacter sichuanensis]